MRKDTILIIVLFAASAFAVGVGVFFTRRLPPIRRQVIQAFLVALLLTPTTIFAHDNYVVPLWWIVGLTFRFPRVQDWFVAACLFAITYAVGHVISAANNRPTSRSS